MAEIVLPQWNHLVNDLGIFETKGDSKMPSIRTLRALAGALGTLALAVTMTTPATADSSPKVMYGGLTNGRQHMIDNGFSSKCLEIRDDRTDAGAPANQWTCNPSNTQRWWARRSASGDHEIVNVNSGLCLEIRGDRTDDGAPANQWPCNGSLTQSWREVSYGVNGSEIRNINSDKCLEILSWGTGDGDAAGLWTCHGGANQRWYIGVQPA
ncbi:RICIN domain-containing protein [Embleya sp. NPDC008237]|uniref:RICIN domain-containing protein n=1 Tax=Embleya sp. NPDC008237 TaxID=3363978 RepID=UPI0036E99869